MRTTQATEDRKEGLESSKNFLEDQTVVPSQKELPVSNNEFGIILSFCNNLKINMWK